MTHARFWFATALTLAMTCSIWTMLTFGAFAGPGPVSFSQQTQMLDLDAGERGG